MSLPYVLGALLLILTLTVLVVLRKGRTVIFLGSLVLICFGLMTCWDFVVDSHKNEWVLTIVYGAIPLLFGCFGFFSLVRSGKEKSNACVSEQEKDLPPRND